MLQFLQDTFFDCLPPHFQVCWLNMAPRSHLMTPRLCGSVLQGMSSDLKNFAIGKTLSFTISLTCALANLLFVLKVWLNSLSLHCHQETILCWKLTSLLLCNYEFFATLNFFKKMSFSLFAWRFSVRNSVHTLNNAR